jgi:hypothetical protein
VTGQWGTSDHHQQKYDVLTSCNGDVYPEDLYTALLKLITQISVKTLQHAKLWINS